MSSKYLASLLETDMDGETFGALLHRNGCRSISGWGMDVQFHDATGKIMDAGVAMGDTHTYVCTCRPACYGPDVPPFGEWCEVHG